MDDDDIYYVEDPRNAARDHRPGGGFGRVLPGRRPRLPVPAAPAYAQVAPPAPVLQHPMYQPPAFVPQVYQQPWLPQGLIPQFPHPMFQPPVTAGSIIGSLFGRVTLGQIVEIGTTLFAAFQKLPPAPIVSEDSAANSANAIIYQEALAEHAKRDEHIRAIGTTAARLLS